MSRELIQTFPRRVDGGLEHQRWVVDLECAAGFGDWSGRGEKRLQREAAEMAQHFPRWLLTVSVERDRVLCPACGGLLVFDRGLRCVMCQRSAIRKSIHREARLAWFGLLPPIGIDGLDRVRESLRAHPPRHLLVSVHEDAGTFLLVPLVAAYPEGFPRVPVSVSYLREFFQIPGIPKDACSHEVHLFGAGRMCLFASGEWRPEMTCREVLQQRAYAHVIKLLNFGNGKRDAFAAVS